MEQQQGRASKKARMGPVDLALYGVILCVHYPLKLTLETYRTSKAVVVTTISLPRRAFNYALSTAAVLKRETERRLSETLNYAKNSSSNAVDQAQHTVASAKDYAQTTSSMAMEKAQQAPGIIRTVLRNSAALALNVARATSSYAEAFLSHAKEEAKHHFETQIHEPKLQYEKALNETASSISDYTASTASAVKQTAEGKVRRLVNFARNVSFIGLDILRQLTEDVNLDNAQTAQSNQQPKSQYERAFAKFQAAAFETERQTLRAEIQKLHEELKRGHQNPSFDKERLKCDKQIYDLQEQLTRIHLTYTQQKQQLLAEFDKERQQYKQEILKLNHQLAQAQANYENFSKKQASDLEGEHQHYQDEIEKLLQKVTGLKQELLKYEGANHSEEIHNDEDTDAQDPYVTETLQKIEAIRKNTQDMKKKIAEFSGTKQDKIYLDLSEQLSKNYDKLDSIDSKGSNEIKKRRKEALRLVQKHQEELKGKV